MIATFLWARRAPMLICLLLIWLWSSPAMAKDLYVSPSGSDAVTYAQNSAATPWATIGRAAWGSTNRQAQNATEAAKAGDTVRVAGGTYAFSGAVGNRFSVLYNTANSGTAVAAITFVCVGRCVLVAPAADSPVIGASGRSYVTWFADPAQGHAWVINACGRQVGCGADVVNTTPDTGPVVLHDSTGIVVEGAVIDGGPGIDFADNWNAFRVENCTACVIRNNMATNFTRDGGANHNQSIITLYGSAGGLIEHNVGSNAGAGVYFKDHGFTIPQRGNVVRFNRFDRVNETIAYSITGEDRNDVYQNIGTNGQVGLAVVGGGLSNDRIVNNTFYRMSLAGVMLNGAGAGGVVANNLCVECDTAVAMSQGSMPGPTVVTLSTNVYSGHRQFYASNSALSFSAFRGAWPAQEVGSIETAAPFVSATDFHLVPSSPARTAGRDASGAAVPSGAYIRDDEVIGVGAAPPPPPPPPPPVDCAVSDWTLATPGTWSACTAGQQTRTETWTRTVTREPANGGLACPAPEETRTASQPCTVEPPPPPALTMAAVVATRTCDLTLTASGAPAGTGWGVTFSRRLQGESAWTAHGSRDANGADGWARGPYTVALGTWEGRAVWTKTGAAAVAVSVNATAECRP